jgi:ABC-type transport system involved in cytochrome bd biosynthesis fused ATPase/permease subunit
MAEADWLNRFVERAAGKTVLVITHRFTTAMRADLIYVMERAKSPNTAATKTVSQKRTLCPIMARADKNIVEN